MILTDRAGMPLSAPNGAARDAFDSAVQLLNGYYNDPFAVIEPVVQAHPDFVMGHLFKAGAMLTATDRQYYPAIADALASAERHLDVCGERERGHFAAARAWYEGDLDGANRLYGDVLTVFPRDVLALQLAHLGDFFLGRSEALRDRPQSVLVHWDDEVSGYGSVLGMLAFGLEECGDHARAESTGLTALSHNRRDPWAIHAVAHVYEMQGRLDEGVRWLEDRRDDWAPDNGFAVHNWWHLALYWLEMEMHDRVLELYDDAIRPEDNDVVLELIDATAMLWRLHLRGVDVGLRWQPLLARWQARADDGLYAFNDIHAMCAQIASGQIDDARTLAHSLAQTARGVGAQALPAHDAAARAARGLIAFAEGRHGQALTDLIDAHRYTAVIGGSLAQRDIFSLTALACAERGDDREIARALSNARRDAKPDSPAAWSAVARWRFRHDSEGAAMLAQRQAQQSQREWLRRVHVPRAQAA